MYIDGRAGRRVQDAGYKGHTHDFRQEQRFSINLHIRSRCLVTSRKRRETPSTMMHHPEPSNFLGCSIAIKLYRMSPFVLQVVSFLCPCFHQVQGQTYVFQNNHIQLNFKPLRLDLRRNLAKHNRVHLYKMFSIFTKYNVSVSIRSHVNDRKPFAK